MCMQINPNSGIANEEHLRYFHTAGGVDPDYRIILFIMYVCGIGRILGKALMDGHSTPIHLVQPLYKHLLGWPVIPSLTF